MDQTPAEQTAGTVRAELARRRVSGRELARALGWSNTTTARRLAGITPFDVGEISAVARFLGVPISELIAEDQQLAQPA